MVLPVGEEHSLEDAGSVRYLECTLQAQEQQPWKHTCHPWECLANMTEHEAWAGLAVSGFDLQWTLSETGAGSDLGLSLPGGCKDSVSLTWGACGNSQGLARWQKEPPGTEPGAHGHVACRQAWALAPSSADGIRSGMSRLGGGVVGRVEPRGSEGAIQPVPGLKLGSVSSIWGTGGTRRLQWARLL